MRRTGLRSSITGVCEARRRSTLVLDDIEGHRTGEKKGADAPRFKSLEAVRDATLEELESTEGMNKRAAESVYAYFREKDRAPEIAE